MMFFTQSSNKPKFEIKKNDKDDYWFVLKASNSKVIATSEMYTSKDACKNGIQSVIDNAPIADVVDTTL